MNPVEKNLFLYNLCLGRNEVKAEIDLRAQGHDGTRSAGKIIIVFIIGLIHFIEMVFYVVFMIDIGRHDNFLVRAVLFPNALQVNMLSSQLTEPKNVENLSLFSLEAFVT